LSPHQQSSVKKSNHSRSQYNKKHYSDENKVGDVGCEHLSKGQWPILRRMLLCKKFLMKKTTLSVRKGVSHSVKQTGQNSKSLLFVDLELKQTKTLSDIKEFFWFFKSSLTANYGAIGKTDTT